jgi:hypothetical protein
LVEDQDVVTNGADIRISSASTVIDTSIGANVLIIGALVRFVRRWRIRQIPIDSSTLVAGDGVDVGKTSSTAESSDGNFRVHPYAAARWEIGGTDSGDIWACGWEVRVENLTAAKTAICISTVTSSASYTGVPGCEDNRYTLHAKLHEFIALALLIGRRKIGFGAAVGDGNHISLWLMSIAMEGSRN